MSFVLLSKQMQQTSIEPQNGTFIVFNIIYYGILWHHQQLKLENLFYLWPQRQTLPLCLSVNTILDE